MILRQAYASDFLHLETFVWQAIFPAFDRPELTDAQRAENDALVAGARAQVTAALVDDNFRVFVAIDPRGQTLAGYVIADAKPRAYAEVPLLLVKRSFWGKGVAKQLLDAALHFIGNDRAVAVAVRYYNQRALAFFAKHGFENTGETMGNFAIARTLLLREAHGLNHEEAQAMENDTPDDWDNFPTEADEPVPVYEALPDYRLTTEDTPIFETGTNALATDILEEEDPQATYLSEDQLSELEAFIARARASKGIVPPDDELPLYQPTVKARPMKEKRTTVATTVADKLKEIPFEVDYGDDGATSPTDRSTITTQRPLAAPAAERPTEVVSAVASPAPAINKSPSFEFAFGATGDAAPKAGAGAAKHDTVTEASPAVTSPRSPEIARPATKACPDCATTLPGAARFCFNCGFPQAAEAAQVATAPQTAPAPPEDDLADDRLELTELADEETPESTVEPPAEPKLAGISGHQVSEEVGGTPTAGLTLSELKLKFRTYLSDRVTAYFGARKVAAYVQLLEASTGFQQLRDGALANLLGWLNGAERSAPATERRVENTLADLCEYFIVETAATLSHGVLPQRLLRHQSINWETADLFQLVMDYLDFDRETEVVYTDFVTMPARALRNATKAYLRTGKDERIFFICDQSLVSQGKNGFAITDSGIYWKNVLQPAGVAMFNELRRVSMSNGHLDLDGQFCNAGGTLNLKLALLLDKLRRMP